MIVLAIDTASSFCSACLYDVDKQAALSRQSVDLGRGHAEHLLGMIDEVMAAAGYDYDAIDHIAVCIGPGSFTGIRVGVAAARGFALALNKPIAGVTTLQAIAGDYAANAPFAVAIKAGRGQAFAQCFGVDASPHNDPFSINLETEPDKLIEPRFSKIIGNAAELVDANRFVPSMDGPTGAIETVARLGVQSTTPPSPLYVRAADAKIAQGFALPRQSEPIR